MKMDRVRIKQILLPFILKHVLIGLISVSLIFILLEMFQLVNTLTNEISLMSDHQHHLTTELVLFYIKNFFFLVLFGSLQFFGLYGVFVENRNILVAYVSSLVVAFIFSLIDYLIETDNSLAVFYLFIQCLLTFAHIYVIYLRRSHGFNVDNSSNIHYILMPKDDACSLTSVAH